VAAWRARRGADARRLAAADAQLPTLLEAVARHLRTGGSLTEAITAQQPGGGLAEPWLVVAVRAPVAGVVAALDGWVAGDDRPPVRLAAAALALAAETGGSPARAVDGVAATLRARAAVAGELRALTSQARASALVIAISPVVFALLASATDRRTRAAFHTGTGTLLVLAGLALDALGAWWMARLCRLPVTVGP
jgi:tight adherence protein B